jgi:HemY protein
MIRTAFILFFICVAAVIGLSVIGAPGQATIEWLGWRLDMTAAAALMAVVLTSLFATLFWQGLIWLIGMPRRAALARAETRRRQGNEVLVRGFLAAAAGDGSEARRLGQKAADLVDDTPALVRLLAAQAAEAAGDGAAVQAAYTAMLGFPDMRLAAHRGLMQAALLQGDRARALRHAQEAYGLAKTARWAWRAVFEHQLQSADWAEALALLKGAQERKIVSPIVADRGRAALLAATAAGLESQIDDRAKVQALDLALQAARLQPGFAPGVVMAARLLQADGKASRASSLIETAWRAGPHPALWLAYRDLNNRETPRARAARLQALAMLNPDHRESQILMVEQALLLADSASALTLSATLIEPEGTPTARLCGLMARVNYAAQRPDEARAWIARGASAPQELDWSDLDPEGRAFAYTPGDWARLSVAYAETGELIHPRFERRERSISELPSLPSAYQASAPFIAAAASAIGTAPLPDDPGPMGDGINLSASDLSAPPPRRAAPRRRMGTKPRPV